LRGCFFLFIFVIMKGLYTHANQDLILVFAETKDQVFFVAMYDDVLFFSFDRCSKRHFINSKLYTKKQGSAQRFYTILKSCGIDLQALAATMEKGQTDKIINDLNNI
jgi:hypothetical protein